MISTASNTESVKSESHASTVEQFRHLLGFNSQVKQSNMPNYAARKFQKEFGTKLSQLLLKKDGLVSFFIACEDLGGESFWQNSAALSAIVKLLATKPSQVKSAEKYYSYILHNLFVIFKSPVWSKRLGLLFTLAIEEFDRVAPLNVSVEIVDRILRPFEVVLERGNLLLSTDDESTTHVLWKRQLDEALWTAARWFEAIASTGPFACHKSFLPMLSFWFHLLGQVESLNADIVAKSAGTSEKTIAETPLSALLGDLRLVCRRLLNSFSTPKEQAQFLLHKILLRSDDTSRYAYFELALAECQSKISHKIQIVGETSANKTDYSFKYPNVKLLVREEPYTLQDLADFSFSALGSIILELTNIESCKLLTALLSETLTECRSTNFTGKVCTFDPLTFRFVPADADVIKHFAKNEDSFFLPHYIMSNLLEIFSNFNFDNAEEMGEQVFLDLIEMAEKIGTSYKNDSSAEAKAPVSDKEKQIIAGKRRLDEILGALELEDYKSATGVARDMAVASRGAALVELAKTLRDRDRTVFSTEGDFERVYHVLIDQLESEDSFVFLAAINSLAELAYWQTLTYFPRMIEIFLDCTRLLSKTSPLTSENENAAMVINPSDHILMLTGKMGEAIAKVAKRLGDFSVVYFDQVSNALLATLRSSDDEILRCSALSALADLIHSCHGRYFDKILQELLLCISQILDTKGAKALERRAAIHLLRSMLQSANDQRNGSIFNVFMESLAPVTAKLKWLWHNDHDDVVRLHAELALIEIDDAVSKAFNPEISLNSRLVNMYIR